jgi:hypothetical protein
LNIIFMRPRVRDEYFAQTCRETDLGMLYKGNLIAGVKENGKRERLREKDLGMLYKGKLVKGVKENGKRVDLELGWACIMHFKGVLMAGVKENGKRSRNHNAFQGSFNRWGSRRMVRELNL